MPKNQSAEGVDSVLITGGAGFIGSNIAHYLVDEGVEVVILDTMSDEYGANPANIESIRSDIDLVVEDVRDEDVVAQHVAGVDAVFHLAAQLSRPISINSPHRDFDINCRGTLNVLEAVRKENPDIPVVFTSSQAVYGKPEELPVTEQTMSDPVDIYGANKLSGEHYCQVYHRVHGLNTVSLRLTNVYGPRAQLDNPNYGVINKFLRLAMQNDALTVYEPGTMVRDPIFVDDVVQALLSAAEADVAGEMLVIGSGQRVTIRDLAEAIIDTVNGGKVELVSWPEKWDSIKVGDIYADPAKAKETLDWKPRTELRPGLEQTVNYYAERFERYVDDE